MESKLLDPNLGEYSTPVRFQDEEENGFGAHTSTSRLGTPAFSGLEAAGEQRGSQVDPFIQRRDMSLMNSQDLPSEGRIYPTPSVKSEGLEYPPPYLRQGGAIRPSSYSRGASVAISVQDGSDDDISSIMMRGAADLRSTKVTVEEQVCHTARVVMGRILTVSVNQRREIESLKCQLRSAKDEKQEALHRLNSVKDAAKKSLENSSKRYVWLLTPGLLFNVLLSSVWSPCIHQWKSLRPNPWNRSRSQLEPSRLWLM